MAIPVCGLVKFCLLMSHLAFMSTHSLSTIIQPPATHPTHTEPMDLHHQTSFLSKPTCELSKTSPIPLPPPERTPTASSRVLVPTGREQHHCPLFSAGHQTSRSWQCWAPTAAQTQNWCLLLHHTASHFLKIFPSFPSFTSLFSWLNWLKLSPAWGGMKNKAKQRKNENFASKMPVDTKGSLTNQLRQQETKLFWRTMGIQ